MSCVQIPGCLHMNQLGCLCCLSEVWAGHMKGLLSPSNPCHIFYLSLPSRGRLGQWIISAKPHSLASLRKVSDPLVQSVQPFPAQPSHFLVLSFPYCICSLISLQLPPPPGYAGIKSVCPLRGCWEGLLGANAARTRTEFFSLWHPRVLKVSLPLWGCMSLKAAPSSSVCSVGWGEDTVIPKRIQLSPGLQVSPALTFLFWVLSSLDLCPCQNPKESFTSNIP